MYSSDFLSSSDDPLQRYATGVPYQNAVHQHFFCGAVVESPPLLLRQLGFLQLFIRKDSWCYALFKSDVDLEPNKRSFMMWAIKISSLLEEDWSIVITKFPEVNDELLGYYTIV